MVGRFWLYFHQMPAPAPAPMSVPSRVSATAASISCRRSGRFFLGGLPGGDRFFFFLGGAALRGAALRGAALRGAAGSGFFVALRFGLTVCPIPAGAGGASGVDPLRHSRGSAAVSSSCDAAGDAAGCWGADACRGSSLIVSGIGSVKAAPRCRSRSTIPGGYEIVRTCPQLRQWTSDPGVG